MVKIRTTTLDDINGIQITVGPSDNYFDKVTLKIPVFICDSTQAVTIDAEALINAVKNAMEDDV